MKKEKEQKQIENIKEYKEHKEICSLTKARSPHSIKIVEDINDSWFLYVLTYKNKSGDITDASMIIASDYESRATYLLDLGWKIKYNK
jgi:hypothetical protein